MRGKTAAARPSDRSRCSRTPKPASGRRRARSAPRCHACSAGMRRLGSAFDCRRNRRCQGSSSDGAPASAFLCRFLRGLFEPHRQAKGGGGGADDRALPAPHLRRQGLERRIGAEERVVGRAQGGHPVLVRAGGLGRRCRHGGLADERVHHGLHEGGDGEGLGRTSGSAWDVHAGRGRSGGERERGTGRRLGEPREGARGVPLEEGDPGRVEPRGVASDARHELAGGHERGGEAEDAHRRSADRRRPRRPARSGASRPPRAGERSRGRGEAGWRSPSRASRARGCPARRRPRRARSRAAPPRSSWAARP